MTELISLGIRQKNGGWVVDYRRMEDGVLLYDCDGPFASKAAADGRAMERFADFFADASEEIQAQIAPILTRALSAKGELESD